jgi:hypothetical protein
MANFKLSTIDRLGKPTSTSMGVADAVTNPQIQAIVDAWDDLLLGAAARGAFSIETVVDQGSAVPPADQGSNRGEKWLYRVQDDVTGQIYTHEIGTADPAQLPSPTSDFVDLTAGNGLALKTAIEAVYESPDGNAGTLLSVQHVTRTD